MRHAPKPLGGHGVGRVERCQDRTDPGGVALAQSHRTDRKRPHKVASRGKLGQLSRPSCPSGLRASAAVVPRPANAKRTRSRSCADGRRPDRPRARTARRIASNAARKGVPDDARDTPLDPYPPSRPSPSARRRLGNRPSTVARGGRRRVARSVPYSTTSIRPRRGALAARPAGHGRCGRRLQGRPPEIAIGPPAPAPPARAVATRIVVHHGGVHSSPSETSPAGRSPTPLAAASVRLGRAPPPRRRPTHHRRAQGRGRLGRRRKPYRCRRPASAPDLAHGADDRATNLDDREE